MKKRKRVFAGPLAVMLLASASIAQRQVGIFTGNEDIGSPALDGSALFGEGVYTLSAGGKDIWNRADQCRFVYRPVSGGFSLTANVRLIERPHAATKCGVMVRESTDPGSRYVAWLQIPGFKERLHAQCRKNDVNSTTNTAFLVRGEETYLRLERDVSTYPDTFRFYLLADGTSPVLLLSHRQQMAREVLAGLALTSHDETEKAVARIDSVALVVTTSTLIRGPATAVESVPGSSFEGCVRIGLESDPNHVGGVELNDSVFTLTGTGSDVWERSDHGQFLFRRVRGNQSLEATVQWRDPDSLHNWAKAGLMVRESFDPGAAHALVLCRKPGENPSVVSQWRLDRGDVAMDGFAAPFEGARVRLRIERIDDIVHMSWKDGDVWRSMGLARPWCASEQYYIGCMVTSHRDTEPASADFWDVVFGAPSAPAVVASGSQTAAALAGPGVTIFQQSVAPTVDYAGCFDTSIGQWRYGHNRGQSDFLEEGDWWGGRDTNNSVLLRFDLSSIPRHTRIGSAVLRLYYFRQRRLDFIPSADHVLYAAALLRSWGEGSGRSYPEGHPALAGEATWLARRHGKETWEVKGARGSMDVRPPESACEPFGTQFGRWIEWDVTKMVGCWIADPRTNHGVKISQDDTVAGPSDRYVQGCYNFLSAQAVQRRQRPMLVVRLAPEAEPKTTAPPLFE